MSNTNETLAAILAEMRDDRIIRLDGADVTRCLLHNLADRIEAAAERERIQRDKVSFRCGDCAEFGGDCDAGDVDGNEDCIACEKFRRRTATGNAAAMRAERERLRDIVRRLSRHLANYITSESENDLLREARAAIGEDKHGHT